jgi:hypothetical protein
MRMSTRALSRHIVCGEVSGGSVGDQTGYGEQQEQPADDAKMATLAR